MEEIVHLSGGVVLHLDSNDASALYSGLSDYPAAAGGCLGLPSVSGP